MVERPAAGIAVWIGIDTPSTRQAVGGAFAVSNAKAMLHQMVAPTLRAADNVRLRSTSARSAAVRARSGPLAAPSP